MSTAALAARPGVLADRFVARSTRVTDVALVVTGAAVVGLLAQVTIPMWPVPITGQTLAVMLVGGALGMRRGAAALTTYMVLGLAGVPWFAELGGGPAYLLKPSFGFVVGFIAAAAVAGWFAERAWDRKPLLAMAGFCLATITPFLVGVPYMAALLGLTDPATIAAYGITPFIVPGLIKAGLAAAAFPLAWRLIRAVDERH
ncbi:biotin transporter BioY [Ornithinimicrobium humiphilum]|uniref:Biotin transporter n=1 Tax=Ornithinimicrobium humiphilum TaxID=125288 RepID=A0A543K6M2_9MICO|nr:biotin transporter BioY [Ornithinimicrobium humiphilum]TQM90726.1 biotin transport system substrate-specific component [Ornithinimicrobium humiphilum]